VQTARRMVAGWQAAPSQEDDGLAAAES